MEIKTIKTPLLLLLLVLGGLFATAGADSGTNQPVPEPKPVVSKTADGKTVNQWLVGGGTNDLYLISSEITPLDGPSNASAEKLDARTNSNSGLHLLFYSGRGSGKIGGMKGLHGFMYMANDWRTPGLAQTNLVDIFSSGDDERIVIMVLDNGPIYSSTNFGMTWKTIAAPGKYLFPLVLNSNGGGFVAEAIIHPSRQNQASVKLPPSNWYAVGAAPDGSKLVMTDDASQSAPVMSITRSDGSVVVSWPATFTGFVLQENSDLSSTNWVDVTNAVTRTAEAFQVLISSPTNNDFYRLRSQ